MQKVFLILIFSLHAVYAFCGICTVSGEVKNFKGSYVVLEKPIDGFFNNTSYDASDTIALFENKFFLKIECINPVFITILFGDHPVRVIIKPGDNILFSIDFSDGYGKRKIDCQFYGNNAKGQEAFYYYNYQPINKFLPIWDILKSSVEKDFVDKIRSEIDKQSYPFKELFTSHEIDTGFYKLVRTTISSLLLFESIRKTIDPNISDINLSSSSKMSVANKLFGLLSPQDEQINYGLYANNYSKLYYKFQKALTTPKKNVYILPDTSIWIEKKKFIIDGDFNSFFYEKRSAIRKYLLGSELMSFLQAGLSEKLKTEIEYFRKMYPSDPYSKAILKYNSIIQIKKKSVDEVKAFEAFPIRIIDSTGFVQDLGFSAFDELKDSLLYVDVWATWCTPCIEEMQYNYAIDSFLFINNAKRVYISIDDIKNRSLWSKTVIKRKLGGYHILAGSQLKKQLTETIGINHGLLAIPHYLIINSGKIVIMDAYRPSAFVELNRQLSEIISNNQKHKKNN